MKEMMRYVTNRKTYLANLCEYYGEPEGVADHLKACQRTPLFQDVPEGYPQIYRGSRPSERNGRISVS